MKIFCPVCGDRIPPARRSRKTDVAVCERCRRAFSLRELSSQRWTAGDLDLHRLPSGVWCDDRGESWRLGTPMRDRTALWLIPAGLVWLFLAIGLCFSVETQSRAEFVQGALLFLGLPALGIAAKATLDLRGQLIVSKVADEGAVFVGLGRWGWTRRFRWSTVQAIVLVKAAKSHPAHMLISLVGPSLRFGGTLSLERQEFLVSALQTLLARPNAARKDDERLGVPFVCPHCGKNSTLVHVDVEHNRAECTECERDFALSDLPEKGRQHFDLGHPPPGAWYEDRGDSWSVGAVTIWFGRVVISKRGDEGTVFVGVGPFGRTTRFRWSKIRHIRENSLIGPPTIDFGGLTEERAYYVTRALQTLAADRGLEVAAPVEPGSK